MWVWTLQTVWEQQWGSVRVRSGNDCSLINENLISADSSLINDSCLQMVQSPAQLSGAAVTASLFLCVYWTRNKTHWSESLTADNVRKSETFPQENILKIKRVSLKLQSNNLTKWLHLTVEFTKRAFKGQQFVCSLPVISVENEI